MEAFVWDDRFVTGLPTVDKQHQHLVMMVNQVGDLVLTGEVAEEPLQKLFHALADYTRFHFAEEERLMAEVGMDKRHADLHKQHHEEFVHQVLDMWRSRNSMADPVTQLHDFLVSWLTVHILGEDQVMGRILLRMQAGEGAAESYEREHRIGDNRVSALLGALHKLYHLLTLQNRDLATANEDLEKKVAERTRELAESNHQLNLDREELRRLLTQVKEAQAQLLEAEKMASVGQLAAGVAHEINNPVGFVTSNLGSLGGYIHELLSLLDVYEQHAQVPPAGAAQEAIAQARRLTDLEFLRQDVEDLLKESRTGLERVTRIIQCLRQFAHEGEARQEMVDIEANLDNSLQITRSQIGSQVEVVREYGHLAPLRCTPGLINQVFFNLILNAAQTIPGNGCIVLRTRQEEDWAVIEVEDNGSGMTPEMVHRAFEPFYTNRPVGGGTGLGLYVSYDIVHRHGGDISIDSRNGAGTTVRVRLPATG